MPPWYGLHQLLSLATQASLPRPPISSRLGQTFEYWRLKVSNESDRRREISLFTFCEFTNQWITFQDRVNLQYSLFIVRGELTDGLLRIAIHDNLTPTDDEALIE